MVEYAKIPVHCHVGCTDKVFIMLDINVFIPYVDCYEKFKVFPHLLRLRS